MSIESITLLLVAALTYGLVFLYRKAQKNLEEKDRQSDNNARDYWLDECCPACGGRVQVQSDNLTRYPYAAKCTSCDLEFEPNHEKGKIPWLISRRGYDYWAYKQEKSGIKREDLPDLSQYMEPEES